MSTLSTHVCTLSTHVCTLSAHVCTLSAHVCTLSAHVCILSANCWLHTVSKCLHHNTGTTRRTSLPAPWILINNNCSPSACRSRRRCHKPKRRRSMPMAVPMATEMTSRPYRDRTTRWRHRETAIRAELHCHHSKANLASMPELDCFTSTSETTQGTSETEQSNCLK